MTSPQPTILLIDDDLDLGTNLIRLIARLFPTYRALWGHDGLEGVDLARQHADQLRLVILDIDMPRMDGNLAAVQIRTLAPHVPVMPFTAHEQSLQTLLAIGCVLPVIKTPEIVTQLPRLIRQAMAAPVRPMPDLPWITAMQQSAQVLAAHAADAIPSKTAAQTHMALMWLDKYCGRYTTPAREVVRARKVLQGVEAG